MPRNRWNREKIIKIIKARHKAGKRLNVYYVQRRLKRLYWSTTRHFGQWRQAVEAAGIDYSRIRITNDRRWNKKKVIQEIQERFKKRKSLNVSVVSKEDPGLYSAAGRHLRGWKRALRLAGFGPSVLDFKHKWTKERVTKEVLRLNNLGISLDHSSLRKKGHGRLLSAGYEQFGSWRRTIMSAGLKYSSVRKKRKNWWTSGRVVYAIRRLEKAGVGLNTKTMESSRRYGLLYGAIKCFGGWGQAVEAAGIDYQKHCQASVLKFWVKKLTTEESKRVYQQSLRMGGMRRRSS